MPCSGLTDPADIELGLQDPADDPTNPIPEVSINDVSVVQDPDQSLWARFRVSMTNINYDDAISMRWDTANGTGTAGTHYTAKINQLLTIPAGEGEGEIEVPVLKPAGASGTKNFFVNLSVPSFCTILDAQGKATVDYGPGGGPPPPPPPPDDPADLSNASGWPANRALIYDQTADCRYYYACTAFSCAAAMSALYNKATGNNQRFDAKKLFTDAGASICSPCVTGCHVFNTVKVLKELRDGNGAKHIDSGTHRSISRFEVMKDSDMNKRIKQIKRAIYNDGAVVVGSQWKQKWNSCSKRNSPNNNDHVLADPSGLPAYLGHAYIFTGWNNQRAGGAFEIQSSFGTGWGVNGRCWMPYAYLRPGWEFYKLTYGG